MSWNLSDLKSILRHIDLPGVTRPMLYFGMWRAMFSFHTVRPRTFEKALVEPILTKCLLGRFRRTWICTA